MEEKKSKDETKKGASMMAPHPHSGKEKKQDQKNSKALLPVEKAAEAAGVKSWETAGLMRAAGWRPGKQVTAGEFDLALSNFRKRPMAGGRIQG